MNEFNKFQLVFPEGIASLQAFKDKYFGLSYTKIIYNCKQVNKSTCIVSVKANMKFLKAQPVIYLSQFYIQGIINRNIQEPNKLNVFIEKTNLYKLLPVLFACILLTLFNLLIGSINIMVILLISILTFVFYYMNWHVYVAGVYAFKTALLDQISTLELADNSTYLPNKPDPKNE